MIPLVSILTILAALSCSTGNFESSDISQTQHRLVGGPCEGCEAIFEYGDRVISSVDTLPEFDKGDPRLKVSGVVFKEGGTIPASDVILYLYHTDQTGEYPKKGGEEGWARRHGYLRGWVKTDEEGRYTFYTMKPASYPSRSNPAHIHVTVLEPDGRYYYIKDFLFKGDPLLSKERSAPRGGEGYLLDPVKEGDLLVAERDIVLGKNVPGYN